MNKNLRQLNQTAKLIERFCKSNPTPTHDDLQHFIKNNGWDEFQYYGNHYLSGVIELQRITLPARVVGSRSN